MRHLRAPEVAPRLMGAADAARYLGVSETTLRGLDLPRRVLGGRKLYDRETLDAYADSLAYEGEGEPTCVGLFGRAS